MNRQHLRMNLFTTRRQNGKYRAMVNRRNMKVWAHKHRAPYPGN